MKMSHIKKIIIALLVILLLLLVAPFSVICTFDPTYSTCMGDPPGPWCKFHRNESDEDSKPLHCIEIMKR